MSDLKISQLSALSGSDLANGDLWPVVDISASETKKISITDALGNGINLIADGTIQGAKIVFSAGQIAGTSIADVGISTAKIANDAVNGIKLANGSTAQLVTVLPTSGDYVGQLAIETDASHTTYAWDGSAWQAIRASGSINAINGDTTSVINIAIASSGTTRTISASIDDTTAASQFLGGPTSGAGPVAARAIVGADLPLSTATSQGAVKVSGEGLRMDNGVLEIDNDVTASSNHHLVTYTAKGTVSGGRAIQSSDLIAATSSAKGAVIPSSTDFTVDGSGNLTLANSTTAGTFTKVTINAAGQVQTGAVLSASDLPNHSATLLTEGTLNVGRFATNSITGNKLANSSVCQFSGATSTTGVVQFPSGGGEFIGQFFMDLTNDDLYVFDGNAWQPVTITSGEIIFSGTYAASNNQITSLTAAGTAQGFSVGSALAAASAANNRYYFVCDASGTGTSPAPTEQINPPDMILSNGSAWEKLDISGFIAGQTATNITVVPNSGSGGGINNTNVQSVLEELDTEKLNKTGGVLTGSLTLNQSSSLIFEGSTPDDYELTLSTIDPTADHAINFPNQSGTVLVSGGASIVNTDVATNAALDFTKLATLASGKLLVGSSGGVATSVSLSGDATLSNTGALTVANSAITNAKVSSSAAIALSKLATGALPTAITITNSNIVSSAAIAGSKISPDFGSQAITTTGNLTLNNQADLRLGDSDGSHYTAIQAGATVGTSYTIELPATVGATGKVLKSTVSGQVATLTWETDATDDAAANLTGTTLASNVVSSSLTSIGTLIGLFVDGDATFIGASSNVVWDKSANAFTGTIAATAFSGPLTGNVTGNCSGTALTVTQAAQTSITSLGTLSSLVISGNLTVDTDTLHVDATNNRVGIGTASPGNLLHIKGGADTKLLIETTGTGHATGIQIKHASGNAAEQTWQIQTDGSADGDLKLRNATAGTDAIVVDPSNNATFAGNVKTNSVRNVDGDLDLYSNLNAKIRVNAGENALVANLNGSVDLYFDGSTYSSPKFQTTSTGTLTSGTKAEISATGASDEPMLKVTSENGQIFLRTAGSSGSFPTGGGGDDAELLYLGGDFRLGIGSASKNLIFMNGSSYNERARINSSGSFKLPDSAKIELGGDQTGSGDLQIYHDGSNSYIKDTDQGNLYIEASAVLVRKNGTTENIAKFIQDGSVQLYYDGGTYSDPKIQTLSVGASITGSLGINTTSPTSFNANADELVLHNGSGTCGMTISCPNDSIGRISFGDPEDNNVGEIKYAHGGAYPNSLQFVVNASERLRIESDGDATFSGDISYPKSTPDGTITTNIPASTNAGDWVTVIPTGTSGIVEAATYIVRIWWHFNSQGNYPYYCAAGTIWVPVNSNDSSSPYGNAVQLLSSHHDAGFTASLSVRTFAGSSVLSGLQATTNGWNPAENSQYRVEYKRIM